MTRDLNPRTGEPLALTSEELGASCRDLAHWEESEPKLRLHLPCDDGEAHHVGVDLHAYPDDVAQSHEAVDWTVAQRMYAHLEAQRDAALREADRYKREADFWRSHRSDD